MKLGRKMLALLLVVCMLLGTIAAATGTTETEQEGATEIVTEPGTAETDQEDGLADENGRGAEPTGGNQIQDNKVSDLMNLQNPLKDKTVTPPYIAAQGKSILMTKENELLLFSSNKTGAAQADEFFNTFEFEETKTNNTSEVEKISANNISYLKNGGTVPGLNMSFVTAVALDVTGNGSDDHVAYLGVVNKNMLRVVLYNARTNTKVATLDIGTVGNWVTSVDHWAYKTFFSITAGDYDNDGVDEIACTNANMGVQMIEIGTGSGSALTLTKGRDYEWDDFVSDTVVYQGKSVAGHMETAITASGTVERRALISLATGNFDGTGAEELAVAVGTNHPGDTDYLPDVPVACTTQVAAVLDPLSTTSAKIRTTSIRTTSKNIEDEELQADVIHTVLYAGQITAGDVNGDRKDEIVVAGYPGKIKVTKDGNTTEIEGRYELYGDYSDGDGDIEYKVALCYATLDGSSSNPSLGHSQITLDAMTPFIDEGFFDYHGPDATNSLLVPMSLDAAKLHGQYGKESVFAGGKVYQFEGGIAMPLYTHEFFETKSTDNYTDAYVEHVTSGAFSGTDPSTGKEMINEQFVFTVVQKDSVLFDDYNYKVGFVGMSTDAAGNSTFFDNTTTMNTDGHLLSGLYGGVEENYGTALVPVAVDIDEDGLRVKYMRAYGHYEDPSVVAVLQAAPYFDELGDWNDFQGSTTYTHTVSRSLIDLQGHSHSIHTGIKGKAGNDMVGELEVKIGYALDMDYEHEMAYTDEYSTTFEAGPYDTVVVQRTPYVCYEYQRVDMDGIPLTGEDEGSVVFMEAMQPIYFQLSVAEYNRFVDEYNAMADRHDYEEKNAEGDPVETVGDSYRLVKITEEILPTNATGNPENYFSTPNDGQYVSQGTYALGHNGGFTTSEFSKEYSYTYTALFAHGMHFEIEGVYMFWPGAGGIGAFAETSFQDTAGWGEADVDTKTSGGKVANIYDVNHSGGIDQNTLNMYGFNWRCVLWYKSLMTDVNGNPYRGANNAEIQVPVVGYEVTDVKSPFAAPTDLEAYLGETGREVVLEWTPLLNQDALQGYTVYRSYDNRAPEAVKGTDTALISPTVYQLTDDTTLRPGKIYTYFVVAHYNTGITAYKSISSNTSTVVWGIPMSFCSCSNGDKEESSG